MNTATNIMNDEEIISLISEYGFAEQEIPNILSQISQRDFESVLSHIEELRGDRKAVLEREKVLKSAKEHELMLKKEAQFKENYKKQLLEKINANREETEKRNMLQSQNIKKTEKSNIPKADIKIKALLNNTSQIILGFNKDSTINDLFQKISLEIGTDKFSLRRFSYSETIEKSDKLILEYFNARSAMIEVGY